jgi:hypothetical protein
MINAELNTSQPEGASVGQATGHSPCDNTTAGVNFRKQLRDQSNSGNKAFVPVCSHRSGAADIKAIVARRDREQNQGRNGSQGERETLADTKASSDKQAENSAKAPADDRPGPVQLSSGAVEDPNSDLADKLEAVKAQIASLLERIESLQPGFVEKAVPEVNAQQVAGGPTAESETCDNQVLLVSMRVLVALLEELVDLLTLNNAENENVDSNAGSAMEPMPSDYDAESCQPETQNAVDMFMSIYDQLSPDTQQETVEILAAMAFEQEEIDQDEATIDDTTQGEATIDDTTQDEATIDNTTIDDTTTIDDPTPSFDNDVPTNNAPIYDSLPVDDLRADPDILPRAGIEGMEVTGIDLFTDEDGLLSEESKVEVNKLIGYLSDSLGGIEVVANVYVAENGNIGVHLTSGDEEGSIFYPMEGTIYSPHVHTNGSWIPSSMDRENELPGAEDAIVVGDGVAGNETGDYFQYA